MLADEAVDPPEPLQLPRVDGRLRYRSGAVARMLRMPVATLRIWERRYQVTAAGCTPSGHRLYAAHDVQRLALLRQLTGLGHAISRIAPLTLVQLQDVAHTHAGLLGGALGSAFSGVLGGVLGPAHKSAPAPMPTGPNPPRRYDDAALSAFASLSANIACECPTHVLALLGQLTQFEDYSAQCQQLNPADAALHAELQRVAGAARALFEMALERIAIHEGLLLPPAGAGAAT